jgi:hypothetical protein
LEEQIDDQKPPRAKADGTGTEQGVFMEINLIFARSAAASRDNGSSLEGDNGVIYLSYSVAFPIELNNSVRISVAFPDNKLGWALTTSGVQSIVGSGPRESTYWIYDSSWNGPK